MSHLTADDVRGYMRRMVEEAGSQKDAAAILRISPAYFNDALRGKREISAGLAERMGFEKVVVFVNRRTAAWEALALPRPKTKTRTTPQVKEKEEMVKKPDLEFIDKDGARWTLWLWPNGQLVVFGPDGSATVKDARESALAHELLNLAGQVASLREALSGLLTWVGQCTPNEYVSWLKERGTPGFEAVEVQTCMFGTLVEAAWQALSLSQEEPGGTVCKTCGGAGVKGGNLSLRTCEACQGTGKKVEDGS